MFTGIIEEVGTVAGVEEVGNGRRFRVSASMVLDGLGLGDSIAVDGVCQTVTELHPDGFEVQAVGTTLGRTTFGALRAGRRVNLERSMALGARLGGHLVQGHVDGVGEVLRIERRDELVLIDFTMPDLVADVTVLHGSIAVNGISMTVNALPEPGVCQLSVIPFTWDHTTFADLGTGDTVNLEGDMIGKFVRHMLGRPLAEGRDSPLEPAHLIRAWGYTRGRES